MKLLNFELKRLFKKNFIGFLVILIISILLMLMYNIIYLNQDYFDNLLNNTNEVVLDVLDITKSTFTNPDGYYPFVFKMISIVCAVYSVNLGIKVASIDKETNIRTFLYTKPIKRKYILEFRLLGIVILLLTLNALIYIASFITLKLEGFEYSMLVLFEIDFSLFLLMIVFNSLGLVIGGFKKGNFPKILLSIITILIFILIHILNSVLGGTILKYINPFSYFKTSEIINTGHYQYTFIIITVFLVVFLASFAIAIYESTTENIKRKDKKNNLK